ncbi:hypothetical protein [Pseudoalteromonas sp. NSLLW218]|uniref:hypothetical protein n=1 Tax=Pseudoalteromonas sp. NSLLW218 TaxID=2792048 RepID=UPI0018CEECF5|nr:hypothetical protein [Pseudoalteromonas sp. NSLLW218]MBH0087659.1 hypothetical protein [Pseudoalteromonas sp. NSLLW218]
MKRQNIVQVLILLLGLILMLSAFIVENSNTNTILLSIGCSIISVVIINFVDYHITLPEKKTTEIVNNWKLISIFETKQSMNKEANICLEKAKKLDIAALGCKGLLNYCGDTIKERLNDGLEIRFLIPKKHSAYIHQREKDEGASKDEINNNLEFLVSWSTKTIKDLDLNPSQIVIKEYDHLPIESIMKVDKNLFTGPFMVDKVSQLTMAYQYRKGGIGYEYYEKYFDSIWSKSTSINLVTN